LNARVLPEPELGQVINLNHDGDGVIHAGKTVFVGGALPGETVRYRRRRKHRQHDEAELLSITAASPLRVPPACPHFGVCGGCALQHLGPASQLDLKQQQLRETLERIGKVTPAAWFAPLTGPAWNYRRRARLGARFVHKRERSLVGFRERWGSYIAAIDTCEVLAEPANRLIEPLSRLLTSLAIRERIPQVELAVAENAVALVLRVLSPPEQADLERLQEFEQQQGVRLYLQPRGLNSVQSLNSPAPELCYTLPEFDLRLEFLPTDFIQVNAGINRALVQRAVELLELSPAARVLDLYCGLGNFTLALARRAGEVVGVEGERGLVARAAANATRNGIGNAHFHAADLAVAPANDAIWTQGRYSHVLLDPPRAGALELLPLIGRLRPQRIVYVSCHPGSLARDLGMLVHEQRFRLLGAGVADMFPHTAHVESIALLEPA